MKPKLVLITLVFLLLTIGSEGIQVRERLNANRATRILFDLQRNLALYREIKGWWQTTWNEFKEAVEGLFDKKSFKITLGVALKLNFAELDIPDMDKKIDLGFELPFTMEIFRIDPLNYQEQEGMVTFSKKNWAIKFSPASKDELIQIIKDNATGILDNLKKLAKDKVGKEANDAVAALLKGLNIKTDDVLVAAIRKLFMAYAKKIAKSYIKSMLLSTAKYVIIALFPPLAPLFAVWAIVKKIINYTKGLGFHVKALNDPDSPGLYELGYQYKLKLLGETFEIELTIDIVVNVEKLQKFFEDFPGNCAKKATEYYDKLKEKIVSSKAFQTIAEVTTEITTVFSAWKEDMASFVTKAKAWKDDLTNGLAVLTDYVNDKVAQISAKQEALVATINNVMEEISNWMDVISDEVLEAAVKVSKSAFVAIKGWFAKLKEKVFKLFTKLSRFSRGKINYIQYYRYYTSYRRRFV